LRGVKEHRLAEEFFLEILQRHFAPNESERQLGIAINWGRSAEVSEFDADRDELYLATE